MNNPQFFFSLSVSVLFKNHKMFIQEKVVKSIYKSKFSNSPHLEEGIGHINFPPEKLEVIKSLKMDTNEGSDDPAIFVTECTQTHSNPLSVVMNGIIKQGICPEP